MSARTPNLDVAEQPFVDGFGSCPAPVSRYSHVVLGHGSGGRLSQELLSQVILPALNIDPRATLEDQAVLPFADGKLALTTDAFVVKPLEFPGGDIGSLAVHGTVNDLAVGGARPLYLTASFILEEGLDIELLRRICRSMRRACDASGVRLVSGDTKVVDRGKADGMFISTAGAGLVPHGLKLSAAAARPGDRIIVSGSIGDHGIAILAAREGIELETTLLSDSAPLAELARAMLEASSEIRCMRDPTRGGVSSALNEIASASGVGMVLSEKALPVRPEVRGACEVLGFDPLYVANEGKLLAIVPAHAVEAVLDAMHAREDGRDAAIIGEVVADHAGVVTMRSMIDGERIVAMLGGEQLPRFVDGQSKEQAMTDTRVPSLTGKPAVPEVDVLWITAGLSCDGDSVSITAATQPSLEEVLMGALPGLPKVNLYHPVLAYETGEDFLVPFRAAARGESPRPFVLVVEGSIPNEKIKTEGFWAAFGTDPATGQPITTCEWIDKIAPHAWGVVAIGTCATYGGIHAMAGNPTGAMGLCDYLGWDWKSKADMPIVCVPGCPVQPDNFMETLVYLLYQAAGLSPMIPLDHAHRPRWLFTQTVHEGCDRGGYYEQGDFAAEYGSKKCIVKLGCWGPVVLCNVGKRGWMNGIGGCPNVGGICIGCTMPGFPDKFMPFMQEPPGAIMSSAAVLMYGRTVRALRNFTKSSLDKEPSWRNRKPELSSGYEATTYAPADKGKAP